MSAHQRPTQAKAKSAPKMLESWYTAFALANRDPDSERTEYGHCAPQWEPGYSGRMGAWRLRCTGPVMPPWRRWRSKAFAQLLATWRKENYGHRVTLVEVLIREDGLILSAWALSLSLRPIRFGLRVGDNIQSYVAAMRKRSARSSPHSRTKRSRRG